MIRNYLKVAWRNIIRRRFYSLLNIAGLSIGILFTLLIGAYIWNEWRVNAELSNLDRQYFLKSIWKDPNLGKEITTVGPLARRLREDYPNLVANYYRWDGITSVVSKGDKHLRENIQLGDSTLLSMFGFDLIYGDPRTALKNPYSAVITKEIAIRYFGKTDVVGETVSIQSFSGTGHDFLITGVLNDIRENSVTQLNADNHNTFFIPTNTFSYFGRADFDNWNNDVLPSYIELQKGVTAADLEKPIAQLIQQNAPPVTRENLTVKAVALSTYYLEMNKGLVKNMTYALGFAALFILLMAVVNFVNISVSSSSGRIKEIGIRKVMGSMRTHIIVQFLTESVILVLIATILAFAAYSFARSFFGEIIGKEIPALHSFPASFILIALLFALLLGALAGLYPAIAFSALKSAESIKGKLKSAGENSWLRKSLTGFQFSMAIVVMISAFVISRQVSHFFSSEIGYNKEYVVSSQLPRDWSSQGVSKIEAIRREFATVPQISSATVSFEIPNGMNSGQVAIYKPGDDSTSAIITELMITDGNYLDTYEIPLQAGSFLKDEGKFDSSKIVLNEAAVHALGWPDASEAIGRQLKFAGTPILFTIAGVTNDFHFASMQKTIQPTVFIDVKLGLLYRFMSFKIRPGNTGAAIAAIQKKWAALLPGTTFEYKFMDDTLKTLYRTEIQIKKASYTAAVLSLIIVLLGVLGLVSLSIQKRIKEIGIRKVLGASVNSIITLFMKEVLSVILVAGLIACPVAWFIMNKWLNNYACRIGLTAQPFVLSVALLALITILLIGAQAFRAGTANPIKSLRTE